MDASKLTAVLTNSGPLRHVVDSMKDLVKCVNMDCNAEGVQIQCTDSANVGLVHLEMRSKIFDSYYCSKPLTFGMNMEYLAKVMKLCGPKDKLTLEVDTGGSGLVNWTFESTEEGDKRYVKTEMPTMDIEQDAIGIPETVYEVEMTLNSSALKSAMHDIKDLGENVTMSASSEGLRLANTGEVGTGYILLKQFQEGAKPKQEGAEEECVLRMTKHEADVSVRFAMRYMAIFTKDSGLAKECHICMKNEEPITLQYNLGDDVSNGFLKFLLAPKQPDLE